MASVLVNVTNVVPIAAANANPNPVAEGVVVNFSSSGSGAAPADTLTYQWDFGDGTPLDNAPNPTHTYTDNGDYTATLTVTDDDGSPPAVASVLVNVTNVAPQDVTVTGPNTVQMNIPEQFSGNAIDVAADNPLTYNWDPGTSGLCDPSSGQIVTCRWVATGTYTITLYVDDGDGGVGTSIVTVLVNSVLPFVWVPLPYTLLRRRWRASGRTLKRILSGKGRRRRW